jgi:putative chitinase
MTKKFILSKNQLTELLKGNKSLDEWYAAMEVLLPKYDINTTQRVAAFISQCAHESANFTLLEENLNYSAEALLRVFPKYFRNRDPSAYARKPEAIANIVYSNRMGNRSEKTGDGWAFRGRGVIQLTGANNYTLFSKYIGKSIQDTTKYLGTKQGALESACWFWETNGINKVADTGDVKRVTKIINGGYNGLEDRQKHYNHAIQVLGGSAKPSQVGPTTAEIQAKLGVTADGIIGPKTIAAISEFQKNNDLKVTGTADKLTLAKLMT